MKALPMGVGSIKQNNNKNTSTQGYREDRIGAAEEAVVTTQDVTRASEITVTTYIQFYRNIQANVAEILGEIIKVCRQLTKLNTHIHHHRHRCPLTPSRQLPPNHPLSTILYYHPRSDLARIIIYGVFAVCDQMIADWISNL